ncbi:hypothetical protein N9I58_01860 [Candidatus Thioglobus sp.]|jgi:hypothetical protein|nr:hypothetical protein [Candidatus Thioglobus sp.]|tara:strand:+ start:48 stop:194 length:147 start_codon:yes stop_codon:yes gene_type:complete
MEKFMEDEEKLNYENKHLIDLTDPHEPSEEQYLESLKDDNEKKEKESN